VRGLFPSLHFKYKIMLKTYKYLGGNIVLQIGGQPCFFGEKSEREFDTESIDLQNNIEAHPFFGKSNQGNVLIVCLADEAKEAVEAVAADKKQEDKEAMAALIKVEKASAEAKKKEEAAKAKAVAKKDTVKKKSIAKKTKK